MKKVCLIIILTSVFLLTGCLGGGEDRGEELMDKLNTEGFYHYTNRGLGFGLFLPPEFEYYHVQRKNTENFVDIEFFTPTADTSYYQEIQSYAKPIVVRVWNQKYWNELEMDDDKRAFIETGRKRSKVYTIKFWDAVPNDWEEKWSQEMGQGIIDRFEVY